MGSVLDEKEAATRPTGEPLPVKYSWVPLGIVAVVVVLGSLLLWQTQRGTERMEDRTPSRFVFVPQFTGKVKITYNVPDAPALRVEEGFRIVEVPASGFLETSSPLLYGTARDEFYRRRIDGGQDRLTVQHIRMRKNGITGDRNEYFDTARELDERDLWMQAMGFEYDESEDGLRYELLMVRDDF